ncbi:hypothetical protein ABZ619_41780 [Streptomyces sp. NPDC007851]|uniref:hypothetical protein n=1 Tax=Streptomyces sp. NPDC007851 TaxID=3155008 RepID=UPI0033F6ABA6
MSGHVLDEETAGLRCPHPALIGLHKFLDRVAGLSKTGDTCGEDVIVGCFLVHERLVPSDQRLDEPLARKICYRRLDEFEVVAYDFLQNRGALLSGDAAYCHSVFTQVLAQFVEDRGRSRRLDQSGAR